MSSGSERPAAQKEPPAEKPEAKPAEKPAAKPEAKPTEKPAAKPTEKPAPPAEKPEAKPAEKPAEKPAPPAAKPKTPPAAAEPEMPEFEGSIVNRITGRFGGKARVVSVKPDRISIGVDREDILEVAGFVRDELNFDHAESVSGVDYPEDKEIEVVYHLGSYLDPSLSRQVLALSTRAPREDVPSPGNDSTRLPSLRDVFYSVEFHERECFEMLGVHFEGHPDNRRLLLPEDWADLPPLRRDFAIKGR